MSSCGMRNALQVRWRGPDTGLRCIVGRLHARNYGRSAPQSPPYDTQIIRLNLSSSLRRFTMEPREQNGDLRPRALIRLKKKRDFTAHLLSYLL